MHDTPYVQDKNIGPEIVASMTAVALEIKRIVPKELPIGIQVMKPVLSCLVCYRISIDFSLW
jgi:predicted TIM-barrel enzyme